MRSRFLLDLTTPDVEGYLKHGDLALLPVGSAEMHGPHMPMGTDMLIARAICLRLAEAADGLVLPDVAYTWAGATDGFAGTISVDAALVQSVVREIAGRVTRMGFRRLVIASVHAPNQGVLYTTVRSLFEHGAPVMLLDLFRPLSPEAERVFEGTKAKEASLLAASCEILGNGLYTERNLSYEDTAPPLSERFERLDKLGLIGWFYQDVRQHSCPHGDVSCAKGHEFIRLQVGSLAAGLGDLAAYREEAAGLANRGTRWIPDRPT